MFSATDKTVVSQHMEQQRKTFAKKEKKDRRAPDHQTAGNIGPNQVKMTQKATFGCDGGQHPHCHQS